MNKKRLGIFLGSIALLIVCSFAAYQYWLAPTRILIINATLAQAADIALNNDCARIEVTCIKKEEVKDLSGYDAIVMYSRGLYLDDGQIAEVERVGASGVPVFTNTLRNFTLSLNHNVTNEQQHTLREYLKNGNKHNYRNALLYLRHIATPHRWRHQDYEPPIPLLENMFYHREYGRYFSTPQEVTAYLKEKNLYHEDGRNLALISGLNFPMEGNRAHVDSLITCLTQAGFNVYPFTAGGQPRADMIRTLHPDAVVYLPMGRLGNDSLINWLHQENIPLFMPFPLIQPHEEWLDPDTPVSGGTLTARVVVPEIDGGMLPLCIATQNENKQGYYLYTAENERIDAVVDHITKYMSLRDMSNKEKRVAICYFKTPGKDALLASGMEVIPSLYNFLKRLRSEGYDVSGLPATVEEFGKRIHRDGAVMGSYAKGAQEQFLKTAHPIWLSTEQYEQWAHEVLLPEKYQEVTDRYGDAPGNLLVTEDSIAITCLQFGNILLFPQPRPALGDDEFKLVHGMPVAPPHSYLAPYLYMQKGFKLHRDLNLDSISGEPYTAEELERLDAFTEEIANEKILGAYYTMNEPYSDRDLLTTTLAVAADPLAYETARKDRDKGKITTEQLQDFTYIAHHYLPAARKRLTALLQNPPKDTASVAPELRPALLYREQLLASPVNEQNAMVRALSGGTVFPAPGGDPVLNPNVLPTGRNMYSINAENTPNPRAWEDGKRLAEATLKQYISKHGEYPRKVSYTFWAGEFINTEGATLAQVFWMLGVEPVRDAQGRVVDLKLVPSEELGRPRINVLVQVSGQLRDIAGSRLKLLTDAIRLASEAGDETYPNYVASGTLLQEKLLVEKGASPKRAREMSVMRVFGPINSGYSTGMMAYTEHSGSWESEKEIAEGYLNNMGASYGDDGNWGDVQEGLFASALSETDVVIQPRQSNTWGPISLDHVYEFTGGLSLTVKTVTGKEPDAYMADYRNRTNRRMQDAKEAIAVETRSTILNPTFIQERMKGGEGSAQMFGEIFRNIFGWHVMRPSAMDKELFNDLYRMYIKDENKLGIHEYFLRVNPAAFQAMTAVMLESARKGYWKASDEQLKTTASLHAQITREKGAACTEFVCDNDKLQSFVADQLDNSEKQTYTQNMKEVHEASATDGKDVVLKEHKLTSEQTVRKNRVNGVIAGSLVVITFIGLVVLLKKRKKE